MEKPRLLLIPCFTELEWVIRDRLAEWAEVASYDPPGVGKEPMPDGALEAIRDGDGRIRDLFVRRALEEVDRRGWERFFVVADGYANATGARVALERPAAVMGIALSHACLSLDMEGERAPMNRAVWEGMRQLLRKDHREFIRHGIVQLTRGSVDDQVAAEMVERFPDSTFAEEYWESLATHPDPIGYMLRRAGRPLLFAQHQGCIAFTEEGFEDAVAAFPDAGVVRTAGTPPTHEEYAQAIRDFCSRVSRDEAGVSGRNSVESPS